MRFLIYCLISLISVSCASEEVIEYEKYLVNGEQIYLEKCANCHGTKGEGLRNLYPSLSSSDKVSNHEFLICLIKNGSKGGVEINGVQYNLAMPANRKMYNLDMAQLITYINFTFSGSEKKVTVEEVKEALSGCKL